MADVQLVNVSASQIIPRGSVLRITFAERLSLQLDSSFAQTYRDDVYANIAGTQLLYPIVADGAIDGEPSATTDCRVSTDAALSTVLAALNDLSPWFVRVAKVQMLTQSQAAQSAQDAGAQQRQGDADAQNAAQDAGNPLASLEHFLTESIMAGNGLPFSVSPGCRCGSSGRISSEGNMAERNKALPVPFAALVAAFSAALGFMSGLAVYGARVAVLETQQASFSREVQEVHTELTAIRSDIQTLTLRLPKATNALNPDSAASIHPVTLRMVGGLPGRGSEHQQPRPSDSNSAEGCWCDTRRSSGKRYAQRNDGKRKRGVARAT
jgi:hypothetical protein